MDGTDTPAAPQQPQAETTAPEKKPSKAARTGRILAHGLGMLASAVGGCLKYVGDGITDVTKDDDRA